MSILTHEAPSKTNYWFKKLIQNYIWHYLVNKKQSSEGHFLFTGSARIFLHLQIPMLLQPGLALMIIWIEVNRHSSKHLRGLTAEKPTLQGFHNLGVSETTCQYALIIFSISSNQFVLPSRMAILRWSIIVWIYPKFKRFKPRMNRMYKTMNALYSFLSHYWMNKLLDRTCTRDYYDLFNIFRKTL